MDMMRGHEIELIQCPGEPQLYRLSPRSARCPLSFKQAVERCWERYADFAGRSRRSEYWWFMLFVALVLSLPMMVSLLMVSAVNGQTVGNWLLDSVVGIVMVLIIGFTALMLLLPSLAVTVRRLHDVGRSAWWMAGSIALDVVATVYLDMAYSLCVGAGFLHDVGTIEMFRSLSSSSMPAFMIAVVLYLANLGMAATVFIFTLLDGQHSENKYGPSPKYPREATDI